MKAKDSPDDSIHTESTQPVSPTTASNQYNASADWDATDPAHPVRKSNSTQSRSDIVARTKFTLPPLPLSTPLHQPPSPVKLRPTTRPRPQETPAQLPPSPPIGSRNIVQSAPHEPGATSIAQPASTPSMRFMFPSAPGVSAASGPLPLNDQSHAYDSLTLPRSQQKRDARKPLILILVILLATFVLAFVGSIVGIAIASRGNTTSAPPVAHSATPTIAHARDTGVTNQPTMPGRRSFQVAPHPLIVINGHKGDMNISTGNSATVLVNAHKHGNTSASGSADTMVKYVQSKDQQGRDHLDISTTLNNANVDFDVTMPATAQVQIQIDGGSIAVNGISGVTIDTFSGSLDLQNIHGPVDVQTENGDITARTLNGSVKMQSQNGSIRVNTVNGQLQALTHNGDVIVRKATLQGQSTLETNSGSVWVEGSLNPAGTYTLKTTHGDIDLSLPANTAFRLTAHTASGSISNDFGSSFAGLAPRPPVSASIAGGGSITIHQTPQ